MGLMIFLKSAKMWISWTRTGKGAFSVETVRFGQNTKLVTAVTSDRITFDITGDSILECNTKRNSNYFCRG